ncbi:hypothetical protein ILYODFUR_003190 [Ilyodon furcidens]|uniref:Uncharacterized protein n=1 Tax=Ilyodon furcidens TaxID=33524 RepID=A0ABV0UFR1_9TELE
MKVQLLLAHLSKKQAAIKTSCSLLIALGLELKMIHLRHAVGMSFSAGIGKLVRVDGKIDGGKYSTIRGIKPARGCRLKRGQRSTFHRDNDIQHNIQHTGKKYSQSFNGVVFNRPFKNQIKIQMIICGKT